MEIVIIYIYFHSDNSAYSIISNILFTEVTHRKINLLTNWFAFSPRIHRTDGLFTEERAAIVNGNVFLLMVTYLVNVYNTRFLKIARFIFYL